jgi:hypothetical protein
MGKKVGLAALLLTLSGVASAGGTSCQPFWFLGYEFDFCSTPPDHNKKGAVAAPEIDPSSAMTGLSLVFGGLAVMRGRRSKNSKQ